MKGIISSTHLHLEVSCWPDREGHHLTGKQDGFDYAVDSV